MTLNVGDLFQQAWNGCDKPMYFKVLSIDRPNNKLTVKCTNNEGYSHEEVWDDLDITEIAFEIGEYSLMN